jgi:predicted DNA-binding protein with PD1-like motif
MRRPFGASEDAMHAEPARLGRTWVLRLDPGEDLLEGLRQAVAELDVRDGVFLSGIGSLTTYHVHVVSSTDLPPTNAFMKGEGPFDILNVSGHVMGGRVHAHLTFSDEEQAMGGHLEPGSHVLTFAIVTLAELLDSDLSKFDRVGALATVR